MQRKVKQMIELSTAQVRKKRPKNDQMKINRLQIMDHFNEQFNELFDDNDQTKTIIQQKPRRQTRKQKQKLQQQQQQNQIEIIIDDNQDQQNQIQDKKDHSIDEIQKEFDNQLYENLKSRKIDLKQYTILSSEFLMQKHGLENKSNFQEVEKNKNQNKKIQLDPQNINYCEILFKKSKNLAEENLECQICNIEYIDGDKLALLECIHRYHLICYNDWQKKSKLCPICQT